MGSLRRLFAPRSIMDQDENFVVAVDSKQVEDLAWRYPDDWPVSPKLKAAVPPGAAVEEPATA